MSFVFTVRSANVVAVYQLTSLEDIKASGNWMWAAKLPGECAKMWKACVALRQVRFSQSKIVADEKPKLSPRGLPFFFVFRFVRPIGIERYGELSGSKFAPAGKVNFVVFASSSISRTFFARVPL